MMGSCSDDFLDKEPSENASEDQIKDLLDKDPIINAAANIAKYFVYFIILFF